MYNTTRGLVFIDLRNRISEDIFGNQVQSSTIADYAVIIIFKIWMSILKYNFLSQSSSRFSSHNSSLHMNSFQNFSLISVMIS